MYIEDMDYAEGVFGYRFIERKGPYPGKLVELYLEDDGYYSLRMTFSCEWAADFHKLSTHIVLQATA